MKSNMTSHYGHKCKTRLKHTTLFMASSNACILTSAIATAAPLFATLHQETLGTVEPYDSVHQFSGQSRIFFWPQVLKMHYATVSKVFLNNACDFPCHSMESVCMTTTLYNVQPQHNSTFFFLTWGCNVEHPTIFYTCLFPLLAHRELVPSSCCYWLGCHSVTNTEIKEANNHSHFDLEQYKMFS